tara:strand:+ start:1435 stop:2937 length:1503 start_codon:yes stop_codon:yes gene_type:complete
MVLEQFTVSLNTEFLSKVLFILLASISITGYLSLKKIYFLSNSLTHYFLIIRSTIFFAYVFIIFSLINFFIPLNDFLVLTFYFIGLFIFIIKYFKSDLIINFRFVLIITFFIILYLLNSGVNNDFGYHAQHINLYKNLSFFDFNSNIEDSRIKYNSGYLLLNSITYFSIIDISIKFLSAYFLSLFILDIKKYLLIKDENHTISKILPIFFLICIYITLSKFKNIGTDYIAHITYLSLILFYLFIYNSHKKFFLNAKFSIILFIILGLLVVLKISMVLCSLILIHFLFVLYKNNKTLNIFSIFILLPILMVSIWSYQNFFLSRCLIYPIEHLCFIENKKSIIFENNMISLFAKSVKIHYWSESIASLEKMNSILFWFPSWFNDHFFKILEKFIPSLIIFNLITYKLLTKKTSYNQNNLIIYETLLHVIWIITILVWFFHAPALRFGFSYLVIIFFILNYKLLNTLKLEYKKIINTNHLIFSYNIFLILMLCYQLYRISISS